jgi:hypothetical protein
MCHKRQVCFKENLFRGEGGRLHRCTRGFESKGNDVRPGMDYWSKHKGLMDHAKKVVKLTTDDGRRLEYVVETITSY